MNLDRANAIEGSCKKAIEKRDEPVDGEIYMLIGTAEDKCIANGNTWEESKVKKENK